MKEVQRRAVVGEKVKIVNAIDACGDYENGDIYMIVGLSRSGDREALIDKVVDGWGEADGMHPFLWDEEYVVLEDDANDQ